MNNTAIEEVEQHPLPEDPWGEPPTSPQFLNDDESPTTCDHTTMPPNQE